MAGLMFVVSMAIWVFLTLIVIGITCGLIIRLVPERIGGSFKFALTLLVIVALPMGIASYILARASVPLFISN